MSVCCVLRKHPAGSADHQTEPAAARCGPEGLPRLKKETRPAIPVCPAHPASLILHTSATQMSLYTHLCPTNSMPHKLHTTTRTHTHTHTPQRSLYLWSCFPSASWAVLNAGLSADWGEKCPWTDTSWDHSDLFISIWLRNLCVVWTMKINFIYCMTSVDPHWFFFFAKDTESCIYHLH